MSNATEEASVITPSMIEEERNLQKNSEVEEEQLRKKAAEEYEEMLEKQRLNRLNELLGKTSIYSNFLAAKLESQRQKIQKRHLQLEQGKEKEKEEKRDEKEKEQPSGGEEKKRKLEEEEISGAKRQKTEVPPDEEDEETKSQRIRERQPKLLTGGVLREYQLQGFEWMVSLFENGLNGILGDEMGLGKTVQCISFLAYLKEKGVWGPFLIVAPLSTLANWISEFERFTPSIPVVLYHGSVDDRLKIRTKKMKKMNDKFPIVVTSYEIVMNDRKHLQKFKWKYIIVDEGHRIKNLNCRLIKELKSYDSANRLLLTGTPLQNNLAELWSLLNFLLPDIFDDLESFQSWFDLSGVLHGEHGEGVIEEESKLQIIAKLHHILKPFLLRRLKADVEKYLPKKREYLVYAPLTEKQRRYYDSILKNELRTVLLSNGEEKEKVEETEEKLAGGGLSEDFFSAEERVKKGLRGRNRSRADYAELSDSQYFRKLYELAELEEKASSSAAPAEPAVNEKTNNERQIRSLRLQNIMMQLRKVCNHPYLFDYPSSENDELRIDEEIVTSSGKFLLLDRLLPALIERGHKVLIFSQMTSMLDILGDYLNYRGYAFCRIDGTTPHEERQNQISAFNTKEQIRFFLLSTRAGGLGINLTSADTCIIYDSDWNPQMDLQAQDRVHRIGQTKPVIVYRLCTAKSFESKMLEKANAKRKLEKLVIHKGKFKKVDAESSSIQLSELREILQSEDGEKIDFGDPNAVISDEDLERILDRSEKAFQTDAGGKGFAVYDAQASEGLIGSYQPD